MGGRHRGDFPRNHVPFVIDHRDAPAAARPPKLDGIREAWASLTLRERKRLAGLQPDLIRAIVNHLDERDTP